MVLNLSEDEIDDLLYLARTGDREEFNTLSSELSKRENSTPLDVLAIAKDEYSGNGVLQMAAANGHAALITQICTSLSQPGPQNPAMLTIINAQNNAGNTALHWAALNGHLDAVKVLMENGADPTITNQKGHDPIYEAELNDKSEVVEWVLKEGGEGLEEGLGGAAGEGEGEDVQMEDGEAVASSSGTRDGSGSGKDQKVFESVEEAMADLNVEKGEGSGGKS